MESKIEKHKKRFTITQIVLMVMAKAPGSCCSLEYLSEKTSVDKDELLVYLSRLVKRGIIERKWHRGRAGKERMYCLKYKEEIL
ncbi:plasmid regulator [Sulfolobus sp. E5-1-F]|uniref:plasmid regulator n=1 Tax=Saccharolobus sp. E5-1-F TaxID=2663019 RepID=UPI001296D9B2|nr:plasmid regulator [Sulfolobus sp. E5-1-F]QGA54570.1 plasmid regulator [Sulfolobus sp. E5-1-F]